jgi:hypothetical protein
VLAPEPGPIGEEGEVEGGGGGEEGGAGQEHPRRQCQQAQAHPTHIRTEGHQNAAVEVDLGGEEFFIKIITSK